MELVKLIINYIRKKIYLRFNVNIILKFVFIFFIFSGLLITRAKYEQFFGMYTKTGMQLKSNYLLDHLKQLEKFEKTDKWVPPRIECVQ